MRLILIPSFALPKTLNFDVINCCKLTPIICQLPYCRLWVTGFMFRPLTF